MKQQTKTNVERLTEWAAFCGHENPRKWLANEVGCSESWINHLFCGKVPGKILRLKICRATKIDATELFGISEVQKKSA